MENPLVFYAIDTNPTYMSLATRSILSLRRRNPKIAVEAHVFGENAAASAGWCAANGVHLVAHAAPVKGKTFLKWHALSHVRAERALFADADTVFFRDPLELFAAYDAADLYAREELASGVAPTRLGEHVLPPQVDHAVLAALAATLGKRSMPVLNTGVMLFNSGAAHRIGAQTRELIELGRRLEQGELPFPCANRHIIEEIAASLALGGVAGLSCGLMTPQLAPMYLECRAGQVAGPGVVLHIWTSLYNQYLDDCAAGLYGHAG